MKIKGKQIGIVGDLHLGSKNGTHADKWEKVYDDVLDWIEESFLHKVDTIMFLGDVFDGRFSKTSEKAMSFRTLDYADKFFERLAENFEVVAFSGNHDVYYKDSCEVSALSLLENKPNIKVITKPTPFEVEDRVYKILPWACCPFDGQEKGEVYDAIFAHLDIQTFKMNALKVSEHGYTPKELFKICDVVYTGHYHGRQQRGYQKGKKEIFYVGTPLQLDWNEAGKESFIYILDLAENKMVEEFENDFSPKHIKINASSIIKNKGKDVGNDIVEVVWDINPEENLTKMEGVLESVKTFSHKMNFKKTAAVDDEEFKFITEAIEPTEQAKEYINQMDWPNIDKIVEKSTSFINIAKV